MFSNRYRLRKVAEQDARACFICYRPTTSVMVNTTPDTDFFYVCPTHVSDPGFAALDAESQLAVKEREAKQKEIEVLKAQWEAVQAHKAKKKGDSKSEEAADKPALATPPPAEALPPVSKVYELNRGVFNLRLGAKRRAAQERKTQTMLSTPGLFPQAPTHKPGK